MIQDSIDLFLKVRKEDVYLICPYLESFEGWAAIRTPYPEEGEYAKLRLMVSPAFMPDLLKLLANLRKRLWFERMD